MAYYAYFSPTTHTASGFKSTSDLPKSYDLNGVTPSYANIKTEGNGTSTLNFGGLTQFTQSEYTTGEYAPLYTLSSSSYQYMPENAFIIGITAWCFPYSWALKEPTFTVNIKENGSIISSKSKTASASVKVSASISYDKALKHDINWLKNSIGFSLVQKGNYSLSTSIVNTDLFECYVIVEYVLFHTITVNATAGGTVTGGGTYETGSSVTIKATPNTGYKFVKWSDGNTNATRTVSVTANATYTAEFAAKSYTISYNGNSATSGSVNPQSTATFADTTLTANGFQKQYTVTLNPNYNGAANQTLTSSATFKGWEDHGDITVSEGANKGEAFTWEQFDAPYYANSYGDLYNAFKYNKQSLVNHYANYGRGEGRSCTGSPRGVYPDKAVVNTLNGVNANDGVTANLYAQWSAMPAVNLPTPTRDGYNFLGWYTASSGGTKVGNSYTPTKNVTLYAHWKVTKIHASTETKSGYAQEIYVGTTKPSAVYLGTEKIYG